MAKQTDVGAVLHRDKPTHNRGVKPLLHSMHLESVVALFGEIYSIFSNPVSESQNLAAFLNPALPSMRSLFLLSIAFAASTQIEAKQAAVAMPDSFSAEAAAQVLGEGGNAVDAAITAQFVLAVTLPEAGNIGGGGFMLVRMNGQSHFLDYRETAPLKSHRDMYLDEKGEVIEGLSLHGILASGVPGTVAGMWEAHRKYASKKWDRLLQPAIELAEKGFLVPPELAANVERFLLQSDNRESGENFANYFSRAKTGETFQQPELAETLKRIAKDGPSDFYRGVTAQKTVAFISRHGGIMGSEDLSSYEAKWRSPIVAQWRDFEILTAPPPSSGGIAVIQWLRMFESLQKPANALSHNSIEYIHVLSEIGKRVFADRAEYLGDPDFVNVPINTLISNAYLSKRITEISHTGISNTENVVPGSLESEETTHFSILDQWGNAVSNTTTINLGFGSGMVVEGAGFILNNEMDDFSAKAGVANAFGALGGTANEVQPRKRMLSSMTPTILLRDGEAVMVTGSPGGTTIITSVYQSILNVVEFGMTASEAVDTPRFHHQLWPKDEIRVHPGIAPEVLSGLWRMGYTIKVRPIGDLQLISNLERLEAASQSTRRGKSIVLTDLP